ncbi:MAG: DegT/DnrJ/EryC1/StrS aminotransferase family protein, partial [Oricola sp.]|nr:DegT/DnrJ/EryC1/StrS aminotransferase family protein [Oricola sp.]
MNSVVNLSIAGKSSVGDIAFIDLKAQQKRIRPKIEKRLQAVLDHGRYIAGPEIDELEETLAERSGASSVISCASGTAALIIPQLARGVGEGDAVFVPAFTYNATANAILLAGATPVFVDIDAATFNIDPADLEHRIAAVRKEGKLQPRAVIPVDLFGSPADYRAISAIAAR